MSARTMSGESGAIAANAFAADKLTKLSSSGSFNASSNAGTAARAFGPIAASRSAALARSTALLLFKVEISARTSFGKRNFGKMYGSQASAKSTTRIEISTLRTAMPFPRSCDQFERPDRSHYLHGEQADSTDLQFLVARNRVSERRGRVTRAKKDPRVW